MHRAYYQDGCQVLDYQHAYHEHRGGGLDLAHRFEDLDDYRSRAYRESSREEHGVVELPAEGATDPKADRKHHEDFDHRDASPDLAYSAQLAEREREADSKEQEDDRNVGKVVELLGVLDEAKRPFGAYENACDEKTEDHRLLENVCERAHS